MTAYYLFGSKLQIMYIATGLAGEGVWNGLMKVHLSL
jgi:hypothetical protein